MNGDTDLSALLWYGLYRISEPKEPFIVGRSHDEILDFVKENRLSLEGVIIKPIAFSAALRATVPNLAALRWAKSNCPELLAGLETSVLDRLRHID
jgi:hypothetical protein